MCPKTGAKVPTFTRAQWFELEILDCLYEVGRMAGWYITTPPRPYPVVPLRDWCRAMSRGTQRQFKRFYGTQILDQYGWWIGNERTGYQLTAAGHAHKVDLKAQFVRHVAAGGR